MSQMDNPEIKTAHLARLEVLGSLISGIAHEINTPIQYIGDNLQFLHESFSTIDRILQQYADLHNLVRRSNSFPSEVQSLDQAIAEAELDFLGKDFFCAIEQSLSGIQQVARISSALKTFARRGTQMKEVINVNQTIEITATICRNEWKYDADLEFHFDEDLPKIGCHIGELSQVWLNLIVNAAHAIRARSDLTRGLISIRTSQCDGNIEVEISDNGAGIPEDAQPHIFEPFFSTKEAGEGSGQGLSICRQIVTEMHGGEIDFWTEANHGTTFIVRLPLLASDFDRDLETEVSV